MPRLCAGCRLWCKANTFTFALGGRMPAPSAPRPGFALCLGPCRLQSTLSSRLWAVSYCTRPARFWRHSWEWGFCSTTKTSAWVAGLPALASPGRDEGACDADVGDLSLESAPSASKQPPGDNWQIKVNIMHQALITGQLAGVENPIVGDQPSLWHPFHISPSKIFCFSSVTERLCIWLNQVKWWTHLCQEVKPVVKCCENSPQTFLVPSYNGTHNQYIWTYIQPIKRQRLSHRAVFRHFGPRGVRKQPNVGCCLRRKILCENSKSKARYVGSG